MEKKVQINYYIDRKLRNYLQNYSPGTVMEISNKVHDSRQTCKMIMTDINMCINGNVVSKACICTATLISINDHVLIVCITSHTKPLRSICELFAMQIISI